MDAEKTLFTPKFAGSFLFIVQSNLYYGVE